MSDSMTSFACFPSTPTTSILSSGLPSLKSEKFSRVSRLQCADDLTTICQLVSQGLLPTIVIGTPYVKTPLFVRCLIFEPSLTATKFLSLESTQRSLPRRLSRWRFASYRDFPFTD